MNINEVTMMKLVKGSPMLNGLSNILLSVYTMYIYLATMLYWETNCRYFIISLQSKGLITLCVVSLVFCIFSRVSFFSRLN